MRKNHLISPGVFNLITDELLQSLNLNWKTFLRKLFRHRTDRTGTSSRDASKEDQKGASCRLLFTARNFCPLLHCATVIGDNFVNKLLSKTLCNVNRLLWYILWTCSVWKVTRSACRCSKNQLIFYPMIINTERATQLPNYWKVRNQWNCNQCQQSNATQEAYLGSNSCLKEAF